MFKELVILRSGGSYQTHSTALNLPLAYSFFVVYPQRTNPPISMRAASLLVDIDSIGFEFDLVELDDVTVGRRVFGKKGKDTRERTVVCR
jgi:hypothetical protein